MEIFVDDGKGDYNTFFLPKISVGTYYIEG